MEEKVLGNICGPLEEIVKKPRLEMTYLSSSAIGASRGVYLVWRCVAH